MSVSYGKSSSYDFAVMISAKYAKFGIDIMMKKERYKHSKTVFLPLSIFCDMVYAV